MNLNPGKDLHRNSIYLVAAAFLLTFSLVVVTNFVIYQPLLSSLVTKEIFLPDPAWMHRFRLGLVLDLCYATGFLVFTVVLFRILGGVRPGVGLFSLLCQLIYLIVWIVYTLRVLDQIHGLPSMKDFADPCGASMGRIWQNFRFDRYYGPLPFYALGSVGFAWLWHKSGWIPRALSISGILACGWCAVCAGLYLLFPGFSNWVNPWLFDLPMAFWSILMSGWLLINGNPVNRKIIFIHHE